MSNCGDAGQFVAAASHIPHPHSTMPDSILHKLARLGRFIAFLCTAGWLFPHVTTEDMDLTRMQNEQMGKERES